MPRSASSTPLPGERPLRFAVVDVETSGLDARSRLLQVGLVVVDVDGTELDRWSSYVRPRLRWCFRIGPRHVHGIARRTLRTAPPAGEVLRELARRLDGTVLVAHNLAFDLGFLQRAAERAGVALPAGPTLCTLDLSRRLDPERTRSHRLIDLCDRYGVVHARQHDALADARATAAVLGHLLAEHGVTGDEAVRAQLPALAA